MKHAFEIVAIAASAGGLRALTHICERLPGDFRMPIVVVQHLDPKHRSLLAEILGRVTTLTVKHAQEGDRLVPHTVYIAPPDRHLLVNSDRTLSLTQSELVHFLRPSADLLFESVAASHRDGAIAVILSGTGNDGTMGLRAVKKLAGTVIVQDHQSAEFSGMPDAAIETGLADFILPLTDIPTMLMRLAAKEMA
jgi:two-component system chemotaxis response regulator CheB